MTSKGGLSRVVQSAVDGEQASTEGVFEALGGVRGIAESVLPGLLFLGWYAFTQDLVPSLVASLAAGTVFVLVRLVRREAVMPGLTGLLGVVFCAAAALFTGSGTGYYIPGFITNAVWIVALLVSLLVRWPLVGVIGGTFTSLGSQWRDNPQFFRVALWTTVAWLVLFALRLAVQLPLFFQGNVEALGIARLVMGLPPYALLLLMTWRSLAAALKQQPEASQAAAQPGSGGK